MNSPFIWIQYILIQMSPPESIFLIENRWNHFGFCVRTTANRSMQQFIMLDYCMHFALHLPPGEVEKKSPVILFLDGLASRRNIPSMLYLKENNIFHFYIAFNTSIQGQSNNNGPNVWRLWLQEWGWEHLLWKQSTATLTWLFDSRGKNLWNKKEQIYFILLPTI